ncbi:hypothetical protein T265_05142 [Opisthorchis viverrini]|uniref:Uncharacterized protein n=1 Tax=Opisthorchis viverrini TaxID=6198 RepID=A0A074ZQ40_OPIVI|nr:hypothetical protein T265_05142 [Opisthorchis viverrini]KER27942.1 hypothetical protein T265_05142 [Opisthorchis viverrini]
MPRGSYYFCGAAYIFDTTYSTTPGNFENTSSGFGMPRCIGQNLLVVRSGENPLNTVLGSEYSDRCDIIAVPAHHNAIMGITTFPGRRRKVEEGSISKKTVILWIPEIRVGTQRVGGIPEQLKTTMSKAVRIRQFEYTDSRIDTQDRGFCQVSPVGFVPVGQHIRGACCVGVSSGFLFRSYLRSVYPSVTDVNILLPVCHCLQVRVDCTNFGSPLRWKSGPTGCRTRTLRTAGERANNYADPTSGAADYFVLPMYHDCLIAFGELSFKPTKTRNMTCHATRAAPSTPTERQSLTSRTYCLLRRYGRFTLSDCPYMCVCKSFGSYLLLPL